jgi:hypothetical protein
MPINGNDKTKRKSPAGELEFHFMLVGVSESVKDKKRDVS